MNLRTETIETFLYAIEDPKTGRVQYSTNWEHAQDKSSKGYYVTCKVFKRVVVHG